MKSKTLAYACDQHYFHYTKTSFATFCEHHVVGDWEVVFVDVGLLPDQRSELSRYGKIISYHSSRDHQTGVIWPTAKARLSILNDLVSEKNVLLYMDSDTLFYENIDHLILEFSKQDVPLAALIEDMWEFGQEPASWSWRDSNIPQEFVNQDKWRKKPMINTGVLLAQGQTAKQIGQAGLKLFEKYTDKIWLGEQTIINTIVYENEFPLMVLKPRYNCLCWERHITHAGDGPAYVNTRPHFRGEGIAIRHFCGSENNLPCKNILDEAMRNMKVDNMLGKHFEKFS